jgi:hypothetical protein
MALTRRLLLFVATSFVAINGAQLALGVSVRDTDLHPIAWFFSGRQGGDSWRPMNEAYDFATTPEGRRKTLYEKLFFSPAVRHKGFQYPPTSLLPIAASRLLGERGGDAAIRAVTWLLIPATALLCLGIYRAGARTAPLERARRGDELWALALAVAATLAFYPAMRAYRNGQIQTWLNALFAAALLASLHGRQAAAGSLVGAMCLIKPQYAVIALWAALRRRWPFFGGAVAVAGLGLLASVALFGLAPHLEYPSVLTFIARRGESFYPNQSVNGLLNRALGNGQNLEWMEQMPASHPWVWAGTLASSLLLLGWALGRRPAAGGESGGADVSAGAADLAMIGVAATAASPIAWEHHYGALLPVFALLAPALHAARVFGRLTLPLLALAHLLASHTLRLTDRLADSPLNPLQSYILAGALIVLLLLDGLRRRVGAAAPETL